MNQKAFTYNRFRAYLRYKFIYQHWHKYFSTKTSILTFVIYILFSLTIFLLPYNILTQYPYLKYFTDFMEFIPAIKQMEVKTFAPEMCKFYASYMFVIALVCWGFLLKEVSILMLVCVLRPNEKYKQFISKIVAKPKRYILGAVVMIVGYFLYLFSVFIFCIYFLYLFFVFISGWTIGHSRYRSSEEYFIYDSYEMLYYAIIEIGFMFAGGIATMIGVAFMYVDILKHNILDKRKK